MILLPPFLILARLVVGPHNHSIAKEDLQQDFKEPPPRSQRLASSETRNLTTAQDGI